MQQLDPQVHVAIRFSPDPFALMQRVRLVFAHTRVERVQLHDPGALAACTRGAAAMDGSHDSTSSPARIGEQVGTSRRANSVRMRRSADFM
jgi:hypothetical protein